MSKHSPEKAMADAQAAIIDAINQAKLVANKYNLSFDLSPAYGMGGTYYSPGALKRDQSYWNECNHPDYAVLEQYSYYVSEENGGWVSSTMECN